MGMMGRSVGITRRPWPISTMVAGALVLSTWCVSPGADAGPFYTYTKDDGSVVVTDDRRKVPKRYRNSVKEFQSKPATPKTRSGGSLASTVREKASRLMELLPDFNLSDRTHYQSFILGVGFVGAVFAFAVMVMSQSPGLKFAMKWVLMFMVVGMVYALYFSELKTYDSANSEGTETSTGQQQSLMQRMKAMGKKIERNQQEHADELNQLTQP